MIDFENVEKELNEVRKMLTKIRIDTDLDMMRDQRDRELAVTQVLKLIGYDLKWNYAQKTGADATGFLKQDQVNDYIEIKSQEVKKLPGLHTDGVFTAEFDKQENPEKRETTMNIGCMVWSMFNQYRETIYADFIIVLPFDKDSSLCWKEYVQSEQKRYLEKMACPDTPNPKRQSFQIPWGKFSKKYPHLINSAIYIVGSETVTLEQFFQAYEDKRVQVANKINTKPTKRREFKDYIKKLNNC